MKNILDGRKDRQTEGRTEVKQYTPPPVERGYNYRLPIKVYYCICTLRHQNRNKSWKPECASSFNMGWQILVNSNPRLWLGKKY
jgi:hypothetical protein